jgi:hypothetical protein
MTLLSECRRLKRPRLAQQLLQEASTLPLHQSLNISGGEGRNVHSLTVLNAIPYKDNHAWIQMWVSDKGIMTFLGFASI